MKAKTDEPTRAELATLLRQIAALPSKTVGALAAQYEQLAGEPTRSRNKQYLVKRVAFLLQEQAHGGLSKAAELKISELGDAVPAEWRARIKQTPKPEPTDPRLPAIGETLTKVYKRTEHTVVVMAGGFQYKGRKYKTLTDVTRAITGKHRGGFEFFGLN
jgi:hypothetical protein